MRRNFSKDLRRWEEGEITSSLLEARYPRQDVSSLTNIFTTLQALGDEPVADMVPSWNEVRSRIASQRQAAPASVLQRLRPGLHRRLAMGVAAALLALPPVAFAASSDTVRDSVGSFVDDVTVFVMGEDSISLEAPTGTTLDAGRPSNSGDAASEARSQTTSSLNDKTAPVTGSKSVAGTTGTSGTSSTSADPGSAGFAGAAGVTAEGSDAETPAAPSGADGSSAPGGSETSPATESPASTTGQAPDPSPSPSPTTQP